MQTEFFFGKNKRIMKQHYERYTREDFMVWQTLYERQIHNLADKACNEFLQCIDDIAPALQAKSIPNFEVLNDCLAARTDWQIEVVKGLIPVEDFFELLTRKHFCSSTWLRTFKQLDYLEEPDMFHDIFGHIPLLTNTQFADFAQKLGAIGVRYKNRPSVIRQLEKIYWFTIEFGLINQDGLKIYGAGILSSFGETNSIFNSNPELIPFDINKIISTEFTKSEMQSRYYVLDSFEQLFAGLEDYEMSLQK